MCLFRKCVCHYCVYVQMFVSSKIIGLLAYAREGGGDTLLYQMNGDYRISQKNAAYLHQ